MENKHNFTGIIIPVIVAVILLTVLPIINSINKECPPCEECPSYDIGNVNVNPDFSSGNFIVDKGSYDYLDNVTIIKDDNLLPENIKKDINIFGIVGTYEESGGGLPIDITNYGLVIITGDHANNAVSNVNMSIPLEAYLVCNDGVNDVNINGELLFYWGSNYSEKGQGLRIRYSFLFKIPSGYSLKEFWLKSNIAWDRDYTNVVVTLNGNTTTSPNMNTGYTTANQFTQIFSYSTPTYPLHNTESTYGPTIYTINLSTYKD